MSTAIATTQTKAVATTKGTAKEAKAPKITYSAAELAHFALHDTLRADYRTHFQPWEINFFVDLYLETKCRTITRQQAKKRYENGAYTKAGRPGVGCPNWFNKNYACRAVELNKDGKTILLVDCYLIPFHLLPADAIKRMGLKEVPAQLRKLSNKKVYEVFLAEHPDAAPMKTKDVTEEVEKKSGKKVKDSKALKAAETANAEAAKENAEAAEKPAEAPEQPEVAPVSEPAIEAPAETPAE